MSGYVPCSCCGQETIGEFGDVCDGCQPCKAAGEPQPSADNWHCFTGYCDGTGCTYPGECETAAR